MLMQIGQKPESDFSEPIGMLEDCHKRIRYFLQTLATLAESAGSAPLNADERDSLERALRYFREAASRHNADEEESLFPELRRHSEALSIIERLAALEADHRWAENQHLEVDAIGRRWLSAGVLHLSDRCRLHAVIHPLLRFYAHHIDLEEREVFPAARRILSARDKEKVGKEMAQRRGLVTRPKPSAIA